MEEGWRESLIMMPVLVRRMEAMMEREWWVTTEKRRWRILS